MSFRSREAEELGKHSAVAHGYIGNMTVLEGAVDSRAEGHDSAEKLA
jgi:hypothetical protein